MHTEILLSRGETVTSFEVPEAAQVKIIWPESKKLTISVPLGQSADFIKNNFENILHSDLLEHLVSAWPQATELNKAGKAVPVESWDDVQIEVVPQKAPKNQAELELDRPRITIQMGLRVDELTDNCKNHLKPEVLEHVIRLWSDPDYCRTVLPVGRNLLIRGCV
jgi:hypothetical protein